MTRLRVGVLVSGRGSNLQALLDAAADPAFPAEIVLVLSNIAGVQALERAAAAGVPGETISHRAYPSREAFERALTETLEAAGVDLVCQAGFMRIVTPWFVEHWRDRLINIHPSLLPAFPGLDTHARALAAGVKLHGCSVHYVRTEVDSGPIIGQAAVPVLADDDPDRLAARVLAAEHRLYPHCLRLLAEGRLTLEGERVRVDGGRDDALLINPPL
ncbi:phosphoribosylglycinamide formyltransferase [Aquibaculum sediminis]|uniref:phosphoribosylglycinamide formyltransferase n=1 Tax=Aquibaculum sediminis TaxID=3231907 RepID=UPI003456E031